jgi:hypothetical protein
MKQIALQIRMSVALHEKVKRESGLCNLSASEWVRSLIETAPSGDRVMVDQPVVSVSKRAVVTTLDSTAPPYVDNKEYSELEKVGGKVCSVCGVATIKWTYQRDKSVVCYECALKTK